MFPGSFPAGSAGAPHQSAALEALVRRSVRGLPTFDGAACLHCRYPHVQCSACLGNCPVDCLGFEDGVLEVGDGCLRCGRCAAVCPTHALCVPGFADPRPEDVRNEPVLVECWKVARELSSRPTLRVPCLGGLGVSWILALCRDAPSAPVFVDRGWCPECTAGGSAEHPVARALAAAREAMAACGVTDDRLPRMQARPLPRALMPAVIAAPAAEQSLSRRGFFKTLAQEVAASTLGTAGARIHEEAGATPTSGHVFPAEQAKRVHVLSEIALRHGCPYPIERLPALRVSERCLDHGVCAGVCPTGALHRYEEGGTRGLRFVAWRCIACGQCLRHCPEEAIQPEDMPSDASLGSRTLTAHVLSECTDCGAAFPRREGEERCPSCRAACDCFAVFMEAARSAPNA